MKKLLLLLALLATGCAADVQSPIASTIPFNVVPLAPTDANGIQMWRMDTVRQRSDARREVKEEEKRRRRIRKEMETRGFSDYTVTTESNCLDGRGINMVEYIYFVKVQKQPTSPLGGLKEN